MVLVCLAIPFFVAKGFDLFQIGLFAWILQRLLGYFLNNKWVFELTNTHLYDSNSSVTYHPADHHLADLRLRLQLSDHHS